MSETDQNGSSPQPGDGVLVLPAQTTGSASPSSGCAPEVNTDTPALERRRQRIALVEEFGGRTADLRKAAVTAVERGMYSPRTNRGDIEASLMRTWAHRHRNYNR